MYGYIGNFKKIRSEVVNFPYELSIDGFLKRAIKKILIEIDPKSKQHIVWEFSAIK